MRCQYDMVVINIIHWAFAISNVLCITFWKYKKAVKIIFGVCFIIMIIKLIINQWIFTECLLCTLSILYVLSHLALTATPNIMPNLQMSRLRLKEVKSPIQVRDWRQHCHSSGGLSMNKIFSEGRRVSNLDRK